MRIDIITLFPGMFQGPFDMSMLKKAQDKGLVKIQIWDLREYGLGARRTVDDIPYGGGDGMVLRPEPIVAAVEAVKAQVPSLKSLVIFLTPSGKKFDQPMAVGLSQAEHLILVAGHYEGFDQRALKLADLELSIGDYVLTGGELPAMAVVDAVVRLVPGVLGGEQSLAEESFTGGLLEYPHYTRPDEFRGQKVPEVLKSGHHAAIKQWRTEAARAKTKQNRPDLLDPKQS